MDFFFWGKEELGSNWKGRTANTALAQVQSTGKKKKKKEAERFCTLPPPKRGISISLPLLLFPPNLQPSSPRPPSRVRRGTPDGLRRGHRRGRRGRRGRRRRRWGGAGRGAEGARGRRRRAAAPAAAPLHHPVGPRPRRRGRALR